MSAVPKDPEALSEAELGETFAVEVAGWRARRAEGYVAAYEIVFADGSLSDIKYGSASHAFAVEARFASSADAVLPWLMKYDSWMAQHGIGDVMVSTDHDHGDPDGYVGIAPTFARAACIALIRAKRAEKGAQS